MAATARAQDESDPRIEAARQVFAQGESEFERRLFVAAARSFERSFTIMHDEIQPPRPTAFLILYNWARALEEAGAFRRAAEIYGRYLEEGGSNEENAAEVRRRIATLQGMAGGGGAISPAGPIVLAIGGAVAIAGAITGGVALSEADALSAMCPDHVDCDPSLQSRFESMRLMSGAADALLFGGLAVAAVGLVLTFTITESGSSDSAQIDVRLMPNELRVRLSGRF